MVEALARRIYSVEEYFEQELASEERHEFFDGEIFPMTGGTPNHNQVALNLSGALNYHVRREPCQVFMTDQRLWIADARVATYPDVMVVAGELAFQPGRKNTVTNPLLIAEVLSRSTESYDRTDKFRMFRTLPSFREYLLMDQLSMHVERYRKTGENEWVFSEYDGAEAVLRLAAFEFEMTLGDLYNKVVFEAG